MLVGTYLFCSRKGQRGYFFFNCFYMRGSILSVVVTHIAHRVVMVSSDTKGVYEADLGLLEGSVFFLWEITDLPPALKCCSHQTGYNGLIHSLSLQQVSGAAATSLPLAGE